MQVAENLRKVISAHQLSAGVKRKSMGRITFSIGVSQYRLNEQLKTFIRRTDDLMYKAKSNGRNQIIGDMEYIIET